MSRNDPRSEHLAWIEVALRRAHPDLPRLRLSLQSHYGPPDRIAYIMVSGTGDDRDRRRTIRNEAGDLLQRLGYTVELEPGRDVYGVVPRRASSAHEEIRMFRSLRAACRAFEKEH